VDLTLRPLYPCGRGSGTRWIGDWVGLRGGLDAVASALVPDRGGSCSLLLRAYRLGSGRRLEKAA
jgi:hypothetical protein